MNIKRYDISRDSTLYEAWPDVALAPDGRLVCVFNECTHHLNREYTRIMQCVSADRGRTWSPKWPVTAGARGGEWYYNCPRISVLHDGRMVLLVDRLPSDGGEARTSEAVNELRFSVDSGESWSSPVELPLHGIVPDQLHELDSGRWLISAHRCERGHLSQFLHWSDDGGTSWSDEVTVASSPELELCEASLLPLGNGVIVACLRENSGRGYDCKKTISLDGGESWGPIVDFPLPGCHRPVAGLLRDGNILITYRFMQGGRNRFGSGAQNFFAALTDRESVLAGTREEAGVRILPVDFDHALKADLGYSGWVEFPDGEVYIVNYIVDDAVDKGQIRGYSFPDRQCFLSA